jgi:hypothetical protein
VQYPSRLPAYAVVQEPDPVSDLVNPNHSKPLPPAAGKFGQLIADGRSQRPAGCPSLEQFEARLLFANDQKSPPRAA